MGVIGFVAVAAPPGVIGSFGSTVLNLAAAAAELKSAHFQFLAGNVMGLADSGEFTEVDLTETGAGEVLGTKGEVVIVDRQGDLSS